MIYVQNSSQEKELARWCRFECVTQPSLAPLWSSAVPLGDGGVTATLKQGHRVSAADTATLRGCITAFCCRLRYSTEAGRPTRDLTRLEPFIGLYNGGVSVRVFRGACAPAGVSVGAPDAGRDLRQVWAGGAFINNSSSLCL